MSLRNTLSQRLRDAWHGTPWYGDSSDKILAGVTAAEASRRIAPGMHTIWEIVLHMTAWTETVGARVRGIGAKGPDRGDWPAPAGTGDAEWAAALKDLADARAALLSEIDTAHEEDLHLHVKTFAEPFRDTGASRGGTVSGLIEHDCYHLGQVAMLKRAVRSG